MAAGLAILSWVYRAGSDWGAAPVPIIARRRHRVGLHQQLMDCCPVVAKGWVRAASA